MGSFSDSTPKFYIWLFLYFSQANLCICKNHSHRGDNDAFGAVGNKEKPVNDMATPFEEFCAIDKDAHLKAVPLKILTVQMPKNNAIFAFEDNRLLSSPSPESLASPKPLNLSNLIRRNYWLLGNSVTRHYSFSIRDILQGTENDVMVNRTEEKSACKGILGTKSCVLSVIANGPAHGTSRIKFGWKNYFGEELAWDDTSRDICFSIKTENMIECLKKFFMGAQRNDVLFVGSLSLNVSQFTSRGGHPSWDSWALSAPLFAESALTGNHTAHIALLLAAFPGAVIWTSYPHVVMNNHVGPPPPGDLNLCFQNVNKYIQSACELHDRALFLDFSKVQSARESEYTDFIHHPGKLSHDITQYMLSSLSGAIS